MTDEEIRAAAVLAAASLANINNSDLAITIAKKIEEYIRGER